jgi:hypothetical protein
VPKCARQQQHALQTVCARGPRTELWLAHEEWCVVTCPCTQVPGSKYLPHKVCGPLTELWFAREESAQVPSARHSKTHASESVRPPHRTMVVSKCQTAKHMLQKVCGPRTELWFLRLKTCRCFLPKCPSVPKCPAQTLFLRKCAAPAQDYGFLEVKKNAADIPLSPAKVGQVGQEPVSLPQSVRPPSISQVGRWSGVGQRNCFLSFRADKS